MLLAALLLLGSPEPLAADPAAEDISARLSQCGVAQGDLSVAWEDDLQGYGITIHSRSAATSDENLACLVEAQLQGGWFLAISDEALRARHDLAYHKVIDPMVQAEARAWLQTRGLLAGLPVYDPSRQSLADYARAIEMLCGVEAGTALEAADGRYLTVKPSAVTAPQWFGDPFSCLLQAVAASNLQEHGSGLVFTGNEAAVPGD